MEEIQKLPHPHSGKELQPVVDMLNFVQKFAPDLADGTGSLHELLKKDIQWTWGSMQGTCICTSEGAFEFATSASSVHPRSTHQGVSRCILLQTEGGPSSEGGCVVFHLLCFLVLDINRAAPCAGGEGGTGSYTGLPALVLPEFTIEMDYHPLLALLKTKGLNKPSPRIQRFCMRLMLCCHKVTNTFGKNRATADALSHASVGSPQAADQLLESDATAFAQSVIDVVPATPGSAAGDQDKAAGRPGLQSSCPVLQRRVACRKLQGGSRRPSVLRSER